MTTDVPALPALTDTQAERLQAFARLLQRYNPKVNLISPDTTHDIVRRHIVHSRALLLRRFPSDAVVVDWGTGGGLPALVLAICCPHVTVHAVDAVGKKVRLVRQMARRLSLDNCFGWHGRAAQWTGPADYSVSRATAPLADIWRWHRRVARPSNTVPDGCWAPGLLCLKGGDLTQEKEALHAQSPDVRVSEHALRPVLDDAYFTDKVLLHVHTP
ncbi:16S rRNA (guanine(527)-N(7))-methyltransferase RsmG [Salisaeta longa]|uniref:16S rRNA (guanine(527)-N(7))-methyltransferase RsmG n=1 Tax=Salisaeta longa TaxID=503170 RepID=UPI0003B71139|nr:RsmG family class I SAM-dependent methyltransferase [Salisaeta longa]